MTNVLIISPFAGGEKAGHPNVDDRFFLKRLSKINMNYTYVTSDFVRRTAMLDHNENIKFIDNCSLNPYSFLSSWKFLRSISEPEYTKVIFCGFTEKLLLASVLINTLSKCRITLIATNNFGKRRVKKFKFILNLIYSICKPKIELIVLHSKFEKKIVESISQSKTFIKKHHLCIPRVKVDVKVNLKSERITIGFMGPNKLEKPLDDMLDLINLDIKKRFDYVFVNCDLIAIPPKTIEQTNVKIISKWFDEEEYDEIFSSFSLVFMGHTADFEGKLSGNLCDSLALSVPWICRKIEPYMEVAERLGKSVCYFYEETQVEALLSEISPRDLVEKKLNIKNQSQKCYSLSEIENDLFFMV